MKLRLIALRDSAQPFCPWGCVSATKLVKGSAYDFEVAGGMDADAVRKSLASVADLVREEKMPPGQAKKADADNQG